MIRKRVITALTFQDGVLFRTKIFNPDYRYTLNFIDSWSVDEIIILDVTRDGYGSRESFYKVVEKFSENCFVPLAVGGFIRSVNDAKTLFGLGADKVVVNTGAVLRPQLISELSTTYGVQSIVLSIDSKKINNRYEVFIDQGKKETGMSAVEWAKKAVEIGVGEIFLNSIDRDGSLQGYDLELCKDVVEAVNVPVLICGGAGNWQHFADGFKLGGAAGVCTQNIYHFTEQSIKNAKNFLGKNGISVRG